VLAAKVVIGIITTLVGIIGAIPVLIGLAIAALIGLAYVFWDDIVDAVKGVIDWMGDLWDTISDTFTDLVSSALDWVSDFASNVVDGFMELTADLSEWATDIASDAYNWGLTSSKA